MNLVAHKVVTDTRVPEGFPVGEAYKHIQVYFHELIKHYA
jgi:hypothetical protein